MGIDRLELKNFKRFKSLSLPLDRSLNVILGENSSGKSSIIKSILGIKQTTSSSNEHEGWAAHGDYVDLGTYQDYIYKKDVSLSFSVGILLSSPAIPVSLQKRFMGDSSKLFISLTYDFDQNTSQSRFLSIKATYGDDSRNVGWEIKRQKTRKNYSVNISRPLIDLHNAMVPDVYKLDLDDKFVVSHVERLTFQRSSISRKISHLNFVGVINSTIGALSEYIEKRTFYLAPLRSSPSRSYIRSSHNLAVGVRGEHTPSVLANLEKRARKVTGGESKNLRDLSFFNDALDLIFPGHTATTRTFDELVKIKIASKDTRDYAASDRSDTITDVGFGFSQVFPILVQMSVMPVGSTLIVEQPELHLHPLAQTRLARVFAMAVMDGKKFIIETHSEHFVRGLQVAVSEARAKKSGVRSENISFIYVRKSGSSSITNLEVNEYGEFTSDWPSGFFDESYRNIRALISNRSKE